MYLFGLPKDEVMSQTHVVNKETSKENSISMVTLFGKQVYPVKCKSSKSGDEQTKINSPKLDIDLRLPADHYSNNVHETVESAKSYTAELGFSSRIEANKMIETSTRKCSGNRIPKIVIDLEEPLTWSSEQSPISHIAKTPQPNVLQIDQSLVKNCKDIDFIKEGRVETSDKELGLLDLNQTPVDDLVSEQPHCFLQDLNCPYTETSCEKSGIDDDITPINSPNHEKEGTSSPASYTSCCTTENNLRSRNSSPLRRELEPEPKPLCRAKLEFSTNKEDSEMIQMAANSLVHISTISQFDKLNDSKIVANSLQDRNFTKVSAKPGCSCDSYELHTLGINESVEEDCCVSSMADLSEMNIKNKEIGLKLRRGRRRMKNFQKEILPSLMSLSRHEIREDINILEAVLRSREYKKMQGKSKCRPLMNIPRNKRSVMQQRCVGRRRR